MEEGREDGHCCGGRDGDDGKKVESGLKKKGGCRIMCLGRECIYLLYVHFRVGVDCLVPKTNPNTIPMLARLRENLTTVLSLSCCLDQRGKRTTTTNHTNYAARSEEDLPKKMTQSSRNPRPPEITNLTPVT